MTTTPFDFLNAVAVLERPDGVVAFPTDTVYGLGCLPKNIQAIEKIYRIKGRAEQKPLILMSYAPDQFEPYLGEMTFAQARQYRELAKQYWPGALTIVVPKSGKVPDAMTRGYDTVGLRVPDCPFLNMLFQMIHPGVLATTSANRSDEPECLTAAAVESVFGNQLDYILRGDNTGSGQPSTVVAIERDGGLAVLRQGSIVLD